MTRLDQEKTYWNECAKDPDVDIKYISDVSTEDCLDAIGVLDGFVLEIGCGVGRLMHSACTGIDISEDMLKIARKRKPDCTFIKNDGRTIPFEDSFFDSVYCVLVFQKHSIRRFYQRYTVVKLFEYNPLTIRFSSAYKVIYCAKE